MEKNSNNTICQSRSPEKVNANGPSEAYKIQQKTLSPASDDLDDVDDANQIKTTESAAEFTNAGRNELYKGHHGHSMSMIPINTTKHEPKDDVWQSTLLQTQNVDDISTNKIGTFSALHL